MNRHLLSGLMALVVSTAHAGGTEHMMDIMDAIKKGDTTVLPAPTKAAVDTGLASAKSSADLSKLSQKTVDFSMEQAVKWEKMTREAYVAALPPKDREFGARMLLGDGTDDKSHGKLYFFVSRSMPVSLLRAYALQALYTDGTLVVKGIRKGDTVNEYIEEALNEFNNADGQLLSGMEINPNLFDMFGVNVVPTTVWTNKAGLDDVGSGCTHPTEGAAVEKITLPGPDDTSVEMDKPTCQPAAPGAYMKIAGALSLPYVLDRFQDAGAPKAAMDDLRKKLAEQRENVKQAESSEIGNAMPPLASGIHLDSLPTYKLQEWKDALAKNKVSRGVYGPIFGTDAEEDPVYRKELMEKIDHGLGVRR